LQLEEATDTVPCLSFHQFLVAGKANS